MGTREGSRPVLPVLRRFGHPHRRWLQRGLFGTLGWVACRLAMPFPLKDVIEAAFPEHHPKGATLIQLAPVSWDPVLWLCGIYVLLAIALGLAELVQRSSMTRFAARTVEDLRAAAVQGAARRGVASQHGAHGDLIARLVGDATHVRRDLNGILVHASQNTLLFVAICGLLLVLSPAMGLFFLAGGGLATFVGYRASRPVAKYARRQRASEGTYAATLDLALKQGTLGLLRRDADGEDAGEGRERASLAVLGDSNLLIHVLLAVTVGAALLVGIHEVRGGSLAPGGLFLFIAYALTVHRRLVQLGRQLARSGKLRASVDRMAALLTEENAASEPQGARGLSSALELAGVRIDSARGHGDKPRLRALDLSIRAGSRIAVLGRPGAGKSTLLRCIAGLEPVAEGAIRWDGVPVDGAPHAGLAYLAQDPVFPPRRVHQMLGLGDANHVDVDARHVLDHVGASRVLRRLPRGLKDRVGSLTLSKSEGRALGLASILLGKDSLWVLDAPLEGLSRKAAVRRLDEILHCAAGRTLVVSLGKFYAKDRFDRVLVLKRGKLKFDGTPAEWEAWRARGEQEALPCAG